jgi:peptide/nickel transport system substrate-binding protein
MTAIGAAAWQCAPARQPRTSILRVAAGADRYNTAPGRFSFTTGRPNVHVAEPPVRPDGGFRARPWLFQEWQFDARTGYTARLRADVVFHDGTPLTADVFIVSARQFIATRDFVGLDPHSLAKIDDERVRFRSSSRSALMVDNMSHPSASLFLPAADVASRPVGTGPYRFVRYEPHRAIEVERFERYWGTPAVNQRVVYRFLADPQARLLALQAGDIDVVSEVVPDMLLGLAPDDSRVVVHRSRPIRYAALLCNLRGNAPFDTLSDRRVRRALALAIDRPAIAGVMYHGAAVPARGLLPAWMFDLGDEVPIGFGTAAAEANALLDEAGWLRGSDGFRQKAGRRLTLRLVAAFPAASAVEPLPELLAQMFRGVGADTQIVEVEDDQLYYSGYADRGQADLFLELAGNANADPTFLLGNLFHSSSPWPSSRFYAPGPAIDDLIDAARAEPRADAAVRHVREAHRRIVDEYVAAIPILLVPVFVLSRPGVRVPMYENADWIDFGDSVVSR